MPTTISESLQTIVIQQVCVLALLDHYLPPSKVLSWLWVKYAEGPTQLFRSAAAKDEIVPIDKKFQAYSHTWGYLFFAWFQTIVQTWFDCFNAEKPTATSRLGNLKHHLWNMINHQTHSSIFIQNTTNQHISTLHNILLISSHIPTDSAHATPSYSCHHPPSSARHDVHALALALAALDLDLAARAIFGGEELLLSCQWCYRWRYDVLTMTENRINHGYIKLTNILLLYYMY